MIDLPGREPIGLTLGGLTLRKDSVGNGKQSSSVLHIMVNDLDGALLRASEAGGKVIGEKMRIPAGPFSYIEDSEGNVVGVWEPVPAN